MPLLTQEQHEQIWKAFGRNFGWTLLSCDGFNYADFSTGFETPFRVRGKEREDIVRVVASARGHLKS